MVIGLSDGEPAAIPSGILLKKQITIRTSIGGASRKYVYMAPSSEFAENIIEIKTEDLIEATDKWLKENNVSLCGSVVRGAISENLPKILSCRLKQQKHRSTERLQICRMQKPSQF